MRWLFTAAMLVASAATLSPRAFAVETEGGALGEIAFTSSTSHPNPFAVVLEAVFTHEEAGSFTARGFYAGNNTWKVRFNLPFAGTREVWSYRVDSTDRQLDGKTGSVTVIAPSTGNRGRLIADGRALRWENTGEPYFILGQTAYALLDDSVPWQEVMDWLQERGFNQIRLWLSHSGYYGSGGLANSWIWGGTPHKPDFSRFNIAQWEKIDRVLREGLQRGFTFEIGLELVEVFPHAGPERTRYLHYLAARLAAYPHLIFNTSFELYRPARGGVHPTAGDLDAAGRELLSALSAYGPQADARRKPLLGLHTCRNFTYHEGNTQERYYHLAANHNLVHRGPATRSFDLRHSSWLTCGILHERWKMEGFGILQHRPVFSIPLFVGEDVYESTDGNLQNNQAHELDPYGMREEVLSHPRDYYRRYTYGVLFSGGVGITYGLRGASIYKDESGNPLERYSTGIPASADGLNGAEGYKDIRRALDYFASKKIDANRLEPDDTRINNGYSQSTPLTDVLSQALGPKRAKFASVAGQPVYLAYNPYHTDLRITGIPPGLSIETFDPRTGEIYSGGQTTGGEDFLKPSEFSGDYVLYIGGPVRNPNPETGN